LPLTSIGLLQYLAPVMQFAVGVGIRHEPMPPARLLGFALVWIALVVLTADALTRRHRNASIARSAEAVAA
jgi:chloramphenicol-sensitive protein RarD